MSIPLDTGTTKLQKLTIKAYKDQQPHRTTIGTFEAMFNPTSLSQTYYNRYSTQQGLGSTGRQGMYIYSKPAELSLKLILDSTVRNEMGEGVPYKLQTVAQQVDQLLNLIFYMNGDTHQPNHLELMWGDLRFWGESKFACHLSSIDIAYTTFDRSGRALRSELDLTLVADEPVQKRLARENKMSPDLTHSRIVKHGDTLPLLCKAVYGQASYYLRVAQVNNLDDFRNLTPGQELIFPPLER